MVSISNMLPDHGNLPSAKTIVSTAASLAASAMVIRSIARDLIPYEFQQYVYLSIHSFFKSFSSEITLIIEESSGLSTNQIYKAAEIYLGTKISPNTNKFMVTMPKMESKISTSMAKNQEIIDEFKGVSFKWRQITRQVESTRSTSHPGQYIHQQEVRYFEVCFHKKHKQMVFESYFPYVLRESKTMKEEKKTLKIYTLNSEQFRRYSGDYSWNSIKLDHPATFDTLAMDDKLKKMIMDDLDMFVRQRDFIEKWERRGNEANRSILVVEDIDCSLEIDDRKAEERALKMLRSSQSQIQTVNIVRKDKANQVTLSGLLNFIDGLWSSCGDERIIVFTTNHKDRLDPVLLRPGRMDVHIFMSYCTPAAFKTLAVNYHGITDHMLFPEIGSLLEETTVTPAEVGEQLLRNENVEVALGGLIQFLLEKKKESDEQKAKEMLLKKKKKKKMMKNDNR
ncbi:UNVERIFIED_CONTAM: protein HYPER-SENSITIVITY-RELATED 4 [Sesamum latifolium]|uniref:Protein HYPER-SENSITIVITY-RELATED 4 n=1 Tax=Sesamum latifolium TaxID=2727402 RepID=A0AAW2V0V3_9LAMI